MVVMFFAAGVEMLPSLSAKPPYDTSHYLVDLPGVYVMSRISILLPATSVDQRHDLTWAWDVTKRNGWRLVLVVSLLPFALRYGPHHLWGYSLLLDFVISVIGCGLLIVEVAALSLSFQYFAQRGNQGAAESDKLGSRLIGGDEVVATDGSRAL